MKQMYHYNATVTKVVDGDTIDLNIDLGFHVHHTIRTRLKGVNAPEVSTAEGRSVRDNLRGRLPIGTSVVVATFKDPTDKYGRWLALIQYGDLDISRWLLTTGQAVPFMETV